MVLLALQLLAVLAVNGWGEESFQQLVANTLVSQSPMAFAGLLLMLIGARLDDPRAQRTAQHWLVAVLSGVLALALAAWVAERVGLQRTPVAGEVPNPLDPPKGCAFHPRCPLANARCRAERPEPSTTGTIRVACHAVQEGRAG